MYGRYSRSSPQYRAHEALDTILKTYYGPTRGYGEGMTMAATHRLQDAYEHLVETLSHAKDRIFGRGSSAEETMRGGGGFTDYLRGSSGGTRGWGYGGEEEDRGILSNVAEKLKYYTGTSDVR